MSHMLKCGVIARCALFPRYLMNDGTFSSASLVRFDKDKKRSGVMIMSVADRRRLDTSDKMHAYGCRAAENANKGKAERLERELERPGQTVHYIAYLDVAVERVVSIPATHYKIFVTARPENGLEEHCEIELSLMELSSPRAARNNEILSVAVKIYELLMEPVCHVCPEDSDLQDLLEA
jgi:hypothetical protein